MSTITFQGVIPPMITPFTAAGDLDLAAHEKNIDRWNEAGLAGYLVLGSNSEAAYLSEEEKLALIAATARRARPGLVILAGTGMESTLETIRLTNRAAAAGAHAALLLTPFYYRSHTSETDLLRHFETIADQSDIPILVYNVPKYTGVNVSPKFVAAVSRHPNIIGMKDSTGDIGQLIRFQAAADPSFQILVGTASVWYPALTLGVRSAIMALANCAPAECVAVQQLFDEGDHAAAEALYRRLVPVNQAVTGTFGIAGLKYACSLRGFAGGCVRAPLAELEEKAKEALRVLLREQKLG